MINRVLIRIRVVQILYSIELSHNRDLKIAESSLNFSLQKSYDLYYYLLLLMIEITDMYSKKIEQGKNKLLPTQEELHPNTRLLDNKFINQLKSNTQFNNYLKERPLNWSENSTFVRKLLDTILSSSLYKEYTSDSDTSYEADRTFWKKTFKKFITENEELEDLLEDESLFWNDDIEIVESFVLKTIKRFDEKNGTEQELLPMYKDEEDKLFAKKLLHETMLNSTEYEQMIAQYAKNWESERIALMDQIVMQIAISEILNFPNIPVSVTLNEYINIAKVYSTQKSASFINGILDTIVADLKKNNRIIKQ
ncbi:N utilization substance protein B [Dysgonomonas sp. PH5-45]|uniref:transcription antitermination factor NusB n=1 Tax=unclassified Dysgonomonas TaxID=2630389 RepID=UPI0024753A5F|nr:MULTISPECIES: transcription antitermination factor NusB [unclassified Dysgonomonas]MDH6354211.1 N utilization substance protein B [Dysgonomonas sp. PH5-45]